ncbi:hypothetical protein AHF37_05884, partial [Paragonimus kellicotti]
YSLFQIERKRHVGNDIVNIIFVDGVDLDSQPSWMPSMMKTHFTHIFAIVTYHKPTAAYRLNVFAEESVPIFGPSLPNPQQFTDPQQFREFLLVKRKYWSLNIKQYPADMFFYVLIWYNVLIEGK